MDLPVVTVVMPVYFPTEQYRDKAQETLESWQYMLYYAGELRLHVSDDGSAVNWCPTTAFGGRTVTYSRQNRHGLGASLNAGFKKAFEVSPIIAYFVDDWQLIHEFDITPWVKALLQNETIGVIRFGPPHPGLTGRVETISDEWQGWGLRLDRHNYAYGDRPMIIHRRFYETYGPFTEDVSALECVRLYDEHFSKTQGCDIILALPHPFYTDTDPKLSLSAMEPK